MLEALLIPTKREKLAARHLSEHTYRRQAAPAVMVMQPVATVVPEAVAAAPIGTVEKAEMAATVVAEEDATAAIAEMVAMVATGELMGVEAAELTALMQLLEPEVPEELTVAMAVMPLQITASLVTLAARVQTHPQ